MTAPASVPITRYILIYLAVSLVLTAFAGIVLEVIGVRHNSGITAAVLMASAVFAGQRFVRDHRRAPGRSEQRRLAAYSLLWSLLSTALLQGALLMLFYGTHGLLQTLAIIRVIIANIPIVNAASILAIALAASYFGLWLAYGWLTRKVTGA